MRSQIEKNKEILWEEMERIGSQKLTPESAARLGRYREAYKTLRMLCKGSAEREEEHSGQERHAQSGPYPYSGSGHEFTRETAMEWTSRMKNEDGTTGPHWTMEKTEEARKQRNIDCDPLKFYVAMNMIYSDYCKAAEKAGANSMDFYVYMSKAFLDDKDAQPDKLERYYHCIVKK